MRRVILVTPEYAETGGPAGLYARALAQALAACGRRVDVIASLTPAARPRHECLGPITVHRLETRRGSPGEATGVQVARRVHELTAGDDGAVIECIDAPRCLLALSALRLCGGRSLTLLSVRIDPRVWADDLGSIGDASIRADMSDAGSIPCPIGHTELWKPLGVEGPVLVGCDARRPDETRLLVDAYRRSRSQENGWSLAVRGRDGRWTVLGGDAPDPADGRQVLVAVSPAAPIAPLLALGCGLSSIVPAGSWLASHAWNFDPASVTSLTEAINRVTSSSRDELRRSAELARAAAGGECGAAGVAAAHEALWDRLGGRTQLAQTKRRWRSLERRLVRVGA